MPGLNRTHSEKSSLHHMDSQGFIKVGRDNYTDKKRPNVIRYTKSELLELFSECEIPDHLYKIENFTPEFAEPYWLHPISDEEIRAFWDIQKTTNYRLSKSYSNRGRGRGLSHRLSSKDHNWMENHKNENDNGEEETPSTPITPNNTDVKRDLDGDYYEDLKRQQKEKLRKKIEEESGNVSVSPSTEETPIESTSPIVDTPMTSSPSPSTSNTSIPEVIPEEKPIETEVDVDTNVFEAVTHIVDSPLCEEEEVPIPTTTTTTTTTTTQPIVTSPLIPIITPTEVPTKDISLSNDSLYLQETYKRTIMRGNSWSRSPNSNVYPSIPITPQTTQDNWYYQDSNNMIQGPFDSSHMLAWHNEGYFLNNLIVKYNDGEWTSLEVLYPNLDIAFIQPPVTPIKKEWYTSPYQMPTDTNMYIPSMPISPVPQPWTSMPASVPMMPAYSPLQTPMMDKPLPEMTSTQPIESEIIISEPVAEIIEETIPVTISPIEPQEETIPVKTRAKKTNKKEKAMKSKSEIESISSSIPSSIPAETETDTTFVDEPTKKTVNENTNVWGIKKVKTVSLEDILKEEKKLEEIRKVQEAQKIAANPVKQRTSAWNTNPMIGSSKKHNKVVSLEDIQKEELNKKKETKPVIMASPAASILEIQEQEELLKLASKNAPVTRVTDYKQATALNPQSLPKKEVIFESNTSKPARPINQKPKNTSVASAWKTVSPAVSVSLVDIVEEQKQNSKGEHLNDMSSRLKSMLGVSASAANANNNTNNNTPIVFGKPNNIFKNTPQSAWTKGKPKTDKVLSLAEIQAAQYEESKSRPVTTADRLRGRVPAKSEPAVSFAAAVQGTKHSAKASKEESIWTEVKNNKPVTPIVESDSEPEAPVTPIASDSMDNAVEIKNKEFENWCKDNMKKLTGNDDLTLVKYCLTLSLTSEIREFFRDYLGTKPEVSSFASEFIKRKDTYNKQSKAGNNEKKNKKRR
ncbi:hypothetical protein WA158_003709 [Blastocystis sp. Blastoise]